MSTVANTFKVREVIGASVGLELEVEGQNLPHHIPGDEWVVKADGSLRNGMEYVFARPLGSVATKAALLNIGAHFEANGTVCDYSFRTSTHVHVNVSNLAMDVAKTIAVLFTLFEDEYLNFCARSRRSNRFCLGIKDADGVVTNLKVFLEQDKIPTKDRGKYSAMNLCTLGEFGTLEFRSLEGTNNWERIFTWVRALLALRKAGKEIGSVNALLKMEPEEVIKLLFPTERLKAQFLKDGWQNRYAMNRSIAHDAIYKFLD